LKELKELRKIVADKDQELEREKREREREKRELEQLRSYLTALAPQQGFDSLPISLPAQTDDQGTGQPPSNNET
jgi:Sec-independent protein translocase protein TatA